MDKRDIHHRKKQFETTLYRLKRCRISDRNKKLILKFKDECLSKGLSIDRTLFYMNRLIKLATWLNKDFSKAGNEDIKNLLRYIEQNERYTAWTKVGYKITLKIFYRWLENKRDGYPAKVEWIKTTVNKSSNKLPDDLLSKNDVEKMVMSANHIRDKALIMVLYESGCRMGELLNIRLKDVEFNQYGAKVVLNGKTGSRRILLISSVPHLANWIENHPVKDDRESPLWVSVGTTNFGHGLDYPAVSKRLKEIAERAGVKKPVNPHNFRHSRATHLAKELTEAQMCQYFGWVQGSRMPATYVHLSGRDLDDAILKIHGKLPKEEEKQREFEVKECPRCGHKNSGEMKFCNRCGLPLDQKVVLELAEKERCFLNLITPEIIERMIEEKVKQMLRSK